MALLEIENLVKSYGNQRVVDGISASVEANTITGLVGPNGAGKSTLFALISGAVAPDDGAIRLGGERIDGCQPDRVYRLGLARTFQVPRPFPQMTVLENLMVAPLRQSGEQFWRNWLPGRTVEREERAARSRALEILEFTGLLAKANDRAGSLSGGQLKLMELARALMGDPKLLLLDEPAAGVNPTLLETLIEKIVALHALGVSFLIIEHNMDMIARLCQPIIVMAQGRRIFEGDANALRRDPEVLDAYLGETAA
jgi:ABC-type branched-subunit amino acid transport system ATPase component